MLLCFWVFNNLGLISFRVESLGCRQCVWCFGDGLQCSLFFIAIFQFYAWLCLLLLQGRHKGFPWCLCPFCPPNLRTHGFILIAYSWPVVHCLSHLSNSSAVIAGSGIISLPNTNAGCSTGVQGGESCIYQHVQPKHTGLNKGQWNTVCV